LLDLGNQTITTLPESGIQGLAWSPDGNWLAGGRSGGATLWDLSQGMP
jgi:WD40 repeat protein